MQVGDLVKVVRADTESRTADIIYECGGLDCGLIIDLGCGTRPTWCGYQNLRRTATILHMNGEVQTWPLDTHYIIKVINKKGQ